MPTRTSIRWPPGAPIPCRAGGRPAIVLTMAVRRIKPNLRSTDFERSRAFYRGVIGLDGGDGLDWILFFGTGQREVQLSVMKTDVKADLHPDVSIEVDDV